LNYKVLVKNLKERLDKLDRLSNDDEDRVAILNGFWITGKDVDSYTRESGISIQEIAIDIGAAAGSLQKHVRFYRQNPQGCKGEINGKPIGWSHYAAVLYIGNKRERDFYLAESAAKSWSSRELRRRIRNNYYENRIEANASRVRGRGALKEINQKLYTYSAEVLKVIDGDTLELNIDVGFQARMRHKVRLRGINCPERKTKKGEEAKCFVEKELFGNILQTQEHTNTRAQAKTPVSCAPVTCAPLVVIRTYKSGKFGRYIVDIWYLHGESDKEVILSQGKLLNQVLLDNKLAQKME